MKTPPKKRIAESINVFLRSFINSSDDCHQQITKSPTNEDELTTKLLYAIQITDTDSGQ